MPIRQLPPEQAHHPLPATSTKTISRARIAGQRRDNVFVSNNICRFAAFRHDRRLYLEISPDFSHKQRMRCENPDPSELNLDLLLLLNDVARLLRIAADKRARLHDMTRAQWIMLLWLDQMPGISQKQLAEKLEVEPITVARLVDRLEQRGMVERRPDPSDRRIWRLHLLPAARPLISDINAGRAEILQLATRELDPSLLEPMQAGLMRMKHTLCSELRPRKRDQDDQDRIQGHSTSSVSSPEGE
ncbi:Transcriptional regulator, MarR family [Granulibacter bethesdensis]|uniref:Transcriptional regulator, MarR family n=2 Tax=Granulibacter bethesdensis TaxID=364410 RepID=A0AAN0VGJ2_9PROT|nr:Transcriptional regulator, MarR family [Granulibacter bethesdensis]APH60421.1 Transcriptional regulator, MarR family [Granulibacter bethesdensis]